MHIEPSSIKQVLDQTLAWSKAQKYLEHSKHDALNSPLLWRLFGRNKITRIFVTQMVMRFPIDIRTMVGVPKCYNPKGLALFVMALLDIYNFSGERGYLEEAERLLSLLIDLRSPGTWQGDCWGYQYPWQDLGFFAPKATPNAVVSAFVCEAFLAAYRTTALDAYLEPVRSCVQFFLNDLTVLVQTRHESCLGYMPLAMNMRVMDVSILVAAVLAQLAACDNNTTLRETALRLTRYVMNRQTPEGAWYYTDPPEDSPVKIDNYHTGFILDALGRVSKALGTTEWQTNYQQGVAFYADHLFNPDGAPRWRSDKDYPHDIHGAAQGILTFHQPENRLRFPNLADKIMSWALTTMYSSTGRFYYQQTSLYTKKITFIRWCNAWMCRALAYYLRHSNHENT
jgi:uncharacterized protein YyaL (SSP411 family)